MTSSSRVVVDLGGTTVTTGFSKDGRNLDWTREKQTQTIPSARDWIASLLEEHPLFSSSNWILGVPGPCSNRSVGQTPNLGPDWSGDDLLTAMDDYDLTFRLENDANLASLGIYHHLDEPRPNPFLCVTLGTGIGGGIVCDGNLVKGFCGGAGELGHLVLVPQGRGCRCGNKGCFERYASATGLELTYENQAGTRLSASTIAQRSDEIADRSFQKTGKYLGRGLAMVTSILNPEMISLAGGLSRSFNRYEESMRSAFRSNVFVEEASDTVIKPATLEHPALLGGLTFPP